MATDIGSMSLDEEMAKLEEGAREESEAAEAARLAEAAQAGEAAEADADAELAAGQAPGAVAAGETPEPGAETAAEAKPEAQAEQTETEPEKQAPVVGVLGKDGQVLPHSVLKGAREDAKRERLARRASEAEVATLREQLAASKKGTTDDQRERATEGLLTDEEREDFPALAKIEAALTKLAKPEPKAEAKPDDKPQDERTIEDEVQDAIDSIPTLASWQASDPVKWKRALKHDETLEESPKWQGKPITERFAHVAKLVAAEYDEQASPPPPPPPSPSPQSKTPAPPPRQDPAKVVQELKRAAPNTLSDFKGGADPGRQTKDYFDMTNDEIEADLARRYGGG